MLLLVIRVGPGHAYPEPTIRFHGERGAWEFTYVLRDGLTALLVESCTFLAQRFPAGAFPLILFLDIVARVAIGVIVMHGLLYRVPG